MGRIIMPAGIFLNPLLPIKEAADLPERDYLEVEMKDKIFETFSHLPNARQTLSRVKWWDTYLCDPPILWRQIDEYFF